VIGGGLGLEQLRTARLALGISLAHFGFLLVGNARRHRTRGNEDARQMAEAQCTDQQPRHDLVADTEVDRAIEHVMRKRHCRCHRDQVAREQRHLHAGTPLSHTVAHGRHTAGDLRGDAVLARYFADECRIALVRLVCGEHVVIRIDDAQVRRAAGAQRGFVVRRTGGEAVREVATGQALAMGAALAAGSGDPGQVALTADMAAFAQALGHFGDDGMQTAHTENPIENVRTAGGGATATRRGFTGTSRRPAACVAGPPPRVPDNRRPCRYPRMRR